MAPVPANTLFSGVEWHALLKHSTRMMSKSKSRTAHKRIILPVHVSWWTVVLRQTKGSSGTGHDPVGIRYFGVPHPTSIITSEDRHRPTLKRAALMCSHMASYNTSKELTLFYIFLGCSCSQIFNVVKGKEKNIILWVISMGLLQPLSKTCWTMCLNDAIWNGEYTWSLFCLL